MHHSLKKEFDALQQAKDILLRELASVKPERLSYKPAPDVWSPLQVAAHLAIVEQRSCDYMERKMKDIQNLEPIGLREHFNLFILRTALFLPLRFKAPAPVRDVPDSPQLSIVVDQWNEARKKMSLILDSIPEQDLKKPIFKHPRSGPTHALGFLLFIKSHFYHHLPQIHSRLQG